MRPGCDCSYCQKKRWATVFVGTTTMKEISKYLHNYYVVFDPNKAKQLKFWESGVYLDEEQVKETVEGCREARRIEARKELQKEKDRIL